MKFFLVTALVFATPFVFRNGIIDEKEAGNCLPNTYFKECLLDHFGDPCKAYEWSRKNYGTGKLRLQLLQLCLSTKVKNNTFDGRGLGEAVSSETP